MQVCILPYESHPLNNMAGPNWKATIILPKEDEISAMKDILATFSTFPDAIRALFKGSGPQTSDDAATMSCHSPFHGPPRPMGDLRPFQTPTKQRVELKPPRFSLKLNLNLVEALSTLGLGPAFEFSSDFAPISSVPKRLVR